MLIQHFVACKALFTDNSSHSEDKGLETQTSSKEAAVPSLIGQLPWTNIDGTRTNGAGGGLGSAEHGAQRGSWDAHP